QRAVHIPVRLMPALDDKVVERDRKDLHGCTPTLGPEYTPVEDTPEAAMARAKGTYGRHTPLPGPSSWRLEPRHETSEPDRAVGAARLGSRTPTGAEPAPADRLAPTGHGCVATRAPVGALWSTAVELRSQPGPDRRPSAVSSPWPGLSAV